MTDSENPRLIIIGGPDGAGKSTVAEFLLKLRIFDVYINADTVALGLSSHGNKSAEMQAGKAMLLRLHEAVQNLESLAFETTLSGRTWINLIQKAKKLGYFISIYFISVESSDISIARIKSRVSEGGHSIPDDTVKRRFPRAHKMFWDNYRTIADEWFVFDNSNGNAIPLFDYMTPRASIPDSFLKRMEK